MNFFFFGAIPHHEMAPDRKCWYNGSRWKEDHESFSPPISNWRENKKEERRNSHRAENNFGEYRSSLKHRIRKNIFSFLHPGLSRFSFFLFSFLFMLHKQNDIFRWEMTENSHYFLRTRNSIISSVCLSVCLGYTAPAHTPAHLFATIL